MRPERLDEHLHSTFELLAKAFSDGIPETIYLPVLVALYPHMSDRALAKVVSFFGKREYEIVYNDIFRAVNMFDSNSDEVKAVIRHLKTYGYDDWVAED